MTARWSLPACARIYLAWVVCCSSYETLVAVSCLASRLSFCKKSVKRSFRQLSRNTWTICWDDLFQLLQVKCTLPSTGCIQCMRLASAKPACLTREAQAPHQLPCQKLTALMKLEMVASIRGQNGCDPMSLQQGPHSPWSHSVGIKGFLQLCNPLSFKFWRVETLSISSASSWRVGHKPWAILYSYFCECSLNFFPCHRRTNLSKT